jgi:hypothetical protein
MDSYDSYLVSGGSTLPISLLWVWTLVWANSSRLSASRLSAVDDSIFQQDGVDWRDQWALAMRAPRAALSNDDANDLMRDIRTTWEDARQVMLKMREQQRA